MRLRLINREFPDKASTRQFWYDAVGQSFIEFFTWGHHHDFGFGQVRNGAMGGRHVEIASESLAFGLLPPDLNGGALPDAAGFSRPASWLVGLGQEHRRAHHPLSGMSRHGGAGTPDSTVL